MISSVIREIDTVIQHLKKNSTIEQDDILQKIQDLANAHRNPLSSTKDCLIGIKSGLSEQITKVRTSMAASNSLDQKATAQLKTEEEYLDKLLAKDGFFQQLVQSINGTNAFTKLLAHQLKLINDLKPLLNNERAQIKSDIASLKVIEKSKLTSFFRDTDFKRLYDATDNYFAAPSALTLEAVTKARDKIKGSELLSPN